MLEYLAGSIITAATFFLSRRITVKAVKNIKIPLTKYTQSMLFETIRPFLVFAPVFKISPKTQTSVFNEKKHVRVVITEDKAYWISNNVFYEADAVDGIVYKESMRPVDTMHMDKVQLNKIAKIVDALTEGGDDENWDSRN